MKRIQVEQDVQYKIMMDSGTTYITTHIIADYGAEAMVGRSTRCLDYRVNVEAVCGCSNNDGPEAGNTQWRRSIEFPDLI